MRRFLSTKELVTTAASRALFGTSHSSVIKQEPVLALQPVIVPQESMVDLKDWPKEAAIELMFATKKGLPFHFCSISHSAIALRNPEDGSFAIYGRQSPLDFFKWLRDGVRLDTIVDNENKYLFPGYNFTAFPTGVFFDKSEVTTFLDSADELINKRQRCNMYSSNCYSFSVTVLADAIETLLARPALDVAAVGRIISVMEKHPLTDHHSIGVLNNQTVIDKLSSVFSAIHKRTDPSTNSSEEEKHLNNKANYLLSTLSSSSDQSVKWFT